MELVGAVLKICRESLVAFEWRRSSKSVVRYLGSTAESLSEGYTKRWEEELTSREDGRIGGLDVNSSASTSC